MCVYRPSLHVLCAPAKKWSTSEYSSIPPEVQAALEEMITHEGYEIPPLPLYFTIVGWSRIHGIIMLELFNHLQPVVGGVSAFYRAEVENLLKTLGYSRSV
jgi:hypothetical protein